MIHLVAEFDNKDAAIFEFCGGGDLRNDYRYIASSSNHDQKVQNSTFWDHICNYKSAHIDFVGRLDLHTVKSFANGESDQIFLVHLALIDVVLPVSDYNGFIIWVMLYGWYNITCKTKQTIDLFWILEIVNGLEYLHKRSILHRDLKSENIFISCINRGE